MSQNAPSTGQGRPADAAGTVTVRPAELPELARTPGDEPLAGLDRLLDMSVHLSAELGRASLTLRQVLALTRGSVVELDRLAGEPVDLYVNDTLVARGEVVVVGEKFGVRVTELAPAGRALREGGR